MPLHDDEMNKRREKREAQRKKQKAEARRLKCTIIYCEDNGDRGFVKKEIIRRGGWGRAIQRARTRRSRSRRT